MNNKKYPFWKVVPHIYILGAGASRAAFPNGDKYGKKLPLMNDFIETLQLSAFFENHNIDYHDKNIEDLYDTIYSQDPTSPILNKINTVIHWYFSGLEIPDRVTLYDLLILSLQEKDVIFSFNWDPLLLQAFARNINVKQLPKIHFLHGNVGIGICIKHKRAGYIGNKCSVCGDYFSPSKLLYPIKSKQYREDPFIASEWGALDEYFDNAFVMTIFGYNSPTTDFLAKEMMLKAWRQNKKYELNEIEIVDIKDKRLVRKNWNDFLFASSWEPRIKSHYAIFKSIRHTLSFRHARRSTEAWGDAIMMCDPWSERRMPKFRNLEKLQAWVKPLVDEEIDFIDKDISIKKYKKSR